MAHQNNIRVARSLLLRVLFTLVDVSNKL